jgi:HK97 family phage major capsid protein
MSIKSDLVAKRNELKFVTDKIAAVRRETADGAGDFDLMKTKALGEGDLQTRVTEMRNLKTKMDSLGVEVDTLVDAVKAFDAPEGEETEQKGGMQHSEGKGASRKSLGDRFADSKEFKAFAAGGEQSTRLKLNFEDVELKTLISTSAGFAPESMRSGDVEGYPVEPVGLFDLIPKGSTSQAAYKYMRQTTRTEAAAERVEGSGAYAESAFAWTEITATVEDVGHWVPITAAQLEDVPQIRGLVDTDLRNGLRERLDYQLFNGSGSTPSLQGGVGLTGINVQDAQGQMPLDALYMGIQKCSRLGFVDANLVAVNGENWEPIQLMKTDDGQYIWGHPADIGPMRVWGRRLISAFRIAKGTALLGDFSKMLYAERKGITVEITDSHDTYFIYGKYAIRATTRGVFVWKRPSAFCKVTNIA